MIKKYFKITLSMFLSLLIVYFWFYFDKENFLLSANNSFQNYFNSQKLISKENLNNQNVEFDTTQIISNIPTPTKKINVPTQIIYPTKRNTYPTLKPTKKPTPKVVKTVTPTKPEAQSVNYDRLKALVKNPPLIGCQLNIPCDPVAQTQTAVMTGLGFATFYGDESIMDGYNVIADVIHNWKKITMDEAKQFILDNMMPVQSNMTPEEARATGKVIAYGATRSCKDEGRIKYMFGVDDPKNPQPYFIGRVMIMDCYNPNDWGPNLSKVTYSYLGWTNLNWIIDLSRNGIIQSPVGVTGNKLGPGGRPGIILIDESVLYTF